MIETELLRKVADLRKEFRKSPNSWFVAKNEAEEDDDEDENSAELVSPRGTMGSHRNKSAEGDEGPIVLETSSPKRTPRGYNSLKKGQWQSGGMSDKESEAKFHSEVEKRVEERLKQQEEAMRNELMQQLTKQTVLSDKEKVLAEIDPKQVVKHYSVGKGYVAPASKSQHHGHPLLSHPSAFGEVFKGLLHGKEVAIKQLFIKDKLNKEVLDEFRKEVQIMMYA